MKKYIGIAVSGLLAIAVGMVLAVQMSSTAGSDQGGQSMLKQERRFKKLS